MTAETTKSVPFVALRDERGSDIYPVKILTRWAITKDKCIEFVMPDDPDFDPERDEAYEQTYDSWGVWDNERMKWAGPNEAAKHFDTYGEAHTWLGNFLASLATSGELATLLLIDNDNNGDNA